MKGIIGLNLVDIAYRNVFDINPGDVVVFYLLKAHKVSLKFYFNALSYFATY